jgi:small subunit ribosomal protein S21
MIIINKNNDDINQMLKKYKRKHRDTQLRRELNKRKQFTKKSVKRRNEILGAIYRDRKLKGLED